MSLCMHGICSSVVCSKFYAPQIEKLQGLLADPEGFGKDFTFTSFEPFPFPLDPNRIVRGIIPEAAHLFKVRC